jgi:DNA-binding transcriptional regulator GbsR (MarR family)
VELNPVGMSDSDPVPDWLTEMDKEILEVLRSELILSPSIISENIGRSRKGVSNRINSLQAGELVKKVDRGKYRITDEGIEVWKSLDGWKYKSRRETVSQEKEMYWHFGVSLEEYQDAVQEEYEKLRQSGEDIEGERDLFDLAFKRVEERLKEENQ